MASVSQSMVAFKLKKIILVLQWFALVGMSFLLVNHDGLMQQILGWLSLIFLVVVEFLWQ